MAQNENKTELSEKNPDELDLMDVEIAAFVKFATSHNITLSILEFINKILGTNFSVKVSSKVYNGVKKFLHKWSEMFGKDACEYYKTFKDNKLQLELDKQTLIKGKLQLELDKHGLENLKTELKNCKFQLRDEMMALNNEKMELKNDEFKSRIDEFKLKDEKFKLKDEEFKLKIEKFKLKIEELESREKELESKTKKLESKTKELESKPSIVTILKKDPLKFMYIFFGADKDQLAYNDACSMLDKVVKNKTQDAFIDEGGNVIDFKKVYNTMNEQFSKMCIGKGYIEEKQQQNICGRFVKNLNRIDGISVKYEVQH